MKETMLERFELLHKTTKAVLYSHIGTLGYARHTLIKEDNSGQKEQLTTEVSAVGNTRDILEGGLAWGRAFVGPEVNLDYSNNKGVTLEAKNTTSIAQPLNEAAKAFEKDLKNIHTLLG